MTRGQWVYTGKKGGKDSFAKEKAKIDQACSDLINNIMKPQFLPEIRPTKFNYPIDIIGKWHGKNYRFIQVYRSEAENGIQDEFDAPFARLEYVGSDLFNISYFRHTGQWHRLHYNLSLEKALETISTDPLLIGCLG